MNAKNHKRFDAEFKQSAVQLALDMENTKKAAESLGISSKTLNTWL